MFFKKNNYFLNLCVLMMLLGIFLGINSMSWLMMWMSMEITLMFFIPKLILNKSMIESFSSLKYFIFQCLGSIFFILGAMDFFFFFNTFGLFMKLGIFPNHYWMLMISKGLNWLNFYFFMTIQKILPLMFLIFSLKKIMFIFLLMIYINSILGNLGSLNQMDLRLLMTFSSMNHLTWMTMSSNMNIMYFYMYFIFYILLLYMMYLFFNKFNIFFLFQIFYMKNLNVNFNIIMISLIFFSFLGFPPLLGFFLKMITLFSMMNFYYMFYMFFMLMQNLIISFSYMRVIIFLYMNLSRSIKMNKFLYKKYFFNYLILIFMFII